MKQATYEHHGMVGTAGLGKAAAAAQLQQLLPWVLQGPAWPDLIFSKRSQNSRFLCAIF